MMLIPKGTVLLTTSRLPSASPPKLSTRPGSRVWTPPYADLDKPEIYPSELSGPKRTRSPLSTDPGLRGHNSIHDDDDAERELQAKAKRLARFRDERSQPETNEAVSRNQKPQQADVLGMDRRKFMAEVSDTKAGHLRNSNLQTDGEDQVSSTVIIGYCPDMCPEQERAERERKGDLDQYERLDGDRNHTTEYLAVKKYTRTAEREAALIRPMEILQKTMDYLLSLLDQPYDDRFLGLYNFLWDRMRAIRMDLRMQHIFNLGAITMLEQMIRLHIIVMHELCEYTKGEGFSEGFDAHLNIEQMNKTSVELFQLYDDHRKNGIEVPTEREFRGYYALLKLDKHPGYKVEPSELSLDLAKMTPVIRQAEQVLFARNVARSCRTGNFIAFFRLVRKANYLQACLMHAHFGKLRTQALAALHSGLQNNQGIPAIQVPKWLGMEEENMEDLLDHGFSIKEFDEPYMVKDGQFLNVDTEYPLKCSKLVHLKRSTTIVADVLSPPTCLMESLPPKVSLVDHTQPESPVFHKEKTPIFAKAVDSQTPIFSNNMQQESSVKTDTRLQPVFSITAVGDSMELASSSPPDIFKTSSSFKSPKSVSTSFTKPSFDKLFRKSLEKHSQSNLFAKNVYVEETLPDVPVEEDPVIQEVAELEPESMIQQAANENEHEIDTSVDEQVAEAKLKLILRLWRRRAFIKKDLRDKKQLAATAALCSLSLGPPVRQCKEQLEVAGDFDFDSVMRERYEKQQLRSRLNVSNAVAATLGKRNKYPNCICWKLLFSSLDHTSWLLYKLMPENISNNDEEIVASLPGVTIWKSSSDLTCYLSVIRNIQADDDLVEETVLGASAVMFLASDLFSWESQKIRLHNIISLIPHASGLPLLVLSDCSLSTVVENLGLNQIDKSKICSVSVLPVGSDESLKKALDWLASESPVQPVVHCVKPSELVMDRLHFNPQKTSPKECISAINNAVDESVKDICVAVKSNPASWPCPEVLLLDFQILESYLPSVGWSSASRIEPLVQALNNCKLPNNKSWCSLNGTDVHNQKVQLEQLLVTYLSPLIGPHLAQREVSTLIQTCVGLELHGSTYYLVPKWTVIFRRIFNWQLTGLSNATAYVLDDCLQSFEDESYNLKSPSLDEMMQVMMIRPGLEWDYKDLEAEAPIEVEEVEMVVDYVEEEEEEEEEEEVEERKVNERSLSRLLEQCNIVQDMIDKKLSIYF
ncbi:SAC3 family protein B-like [Bidens hawaiensis]|uniref:SAC3 family protein B-like n=1 Tax=Bidens hawaiensis TaxID=980011 RepID=UPI00404A8C32